jgi:hypothetical protein
MTQLPLLADVERVERPHKRTTRTSRAAWLEAELNGRLREREFIVGKALKFLWNKHQRSVTSKRLAQWIRMDGRAWVGREWFWILLETRKALCGLRSKGLADRIDDGGPLLLWRYREAGTGERPTDQRRAS